MEIKFNFDDIRPFNDGEISSALGLLINEPEFLGLLAQVAPQVPADMIRQYAPTFKTLYDFQLAFIRPVGEDLISKLTDGFTTAMADAADRRPALLLSNHRDIVVDPLFINMALVRNGRQTCEIAIGDNLLIKKWIEVLVRLNRSFIVRRGLQPREMAQAFMQLSAYIRYAIAEKGVDAWIAQREGRAKDSNDRTQESLIKMLALSGKEDFISNLKALNISPVSLSYEFDPCDYLKAKEFQMRRDDAGFRKSKQDDLMSMQVGITGYKGRVNIEFSSSINVELDAIAASGLNKKEQAAAVCALCDKRIFTNYVIYPVNRWAFEQLTGDSRFAAVDSAEERGKAEKYLRSRLAKVEAELTNPDSDFLWKKLLEMYANPLINKISVE